MKKLLYTDKKGISEMISYVLLVIIAIGLSVLVFGYLTLYVPKDKPACIDGISLAIKDSSCIYESARSSLTLDFVNNGKFSVHAVYVRFGEENRSVRELINDPNDLINNPSKGSFFFDLTDPKQGLKPGESTQRDYVISSNIVKNEGKYLVEIQPAVFDEGDLVICENAVIIQKVTCSVL
ncbi:MAG: hypothetical protein AABW80_01530 [Nanoarchaeota archaeon]